MTTHTNDKPKNSYCVIGVNDVSEKPGKAVKAQVAYIISELQSKYWREFRKKSDILGSFIISSNVERNKLVDYVLKSDPNFDPLPLCIEKLENMTGKSIEELRKEEGIKFFEYKQTLCAHGANRYMFYYFD